CAVGTDDVVALAAVDKVGAEATVEPVVAAVAVEDVVAAAADQAVVIGAARERVVAVAGGDVEDVDAGEIEPGGGAGDEAVIAIGVLRLDGEDDLGRAEEAVGDRVE